MNIQSHSIQSIAGDDMLVLDFFAKFSRFECALKRAGFVKRGAAGASLRLGQAVELKPNCEVSWHE